ncbi:MULTISPECIES: tRNA uracil 4-sulfurtransferase ThiI [unclassified Colwellia]|jgi:thiamine biosynthesis protein ThiI|uniref:tRNA uracil 4-sulfurtransferase ThiI n=1 Tax=unclassified Colwellia TaxID=196834 RepID=UPI000D3AD58F|nr:MULTISPECIES: tRNA uracil 4-sulfurtransferase ThiI [unclassified Colwellia]AWB58855.1 tRNA 4-thiouridine(8) synthase ThiI [Colwellia sp. Arc7-D]MBA6415644.1 tRNA 4-thiouridine(8) synthase ThiI [Colwellia sp. 6M3]|tara:strand:+ start:6241 stop:7695 length:1455 start_codon:yes stop_codon:yes gene_type:complete
MKFIVKLQAEITIKSRPVRKRFTKILESSVKNVLRRVDEQVTTRMNWDNIEVNTANNSPENRLKLIDTLKSIPGIPMFLEVQQTDFTDLHDIYEKTAAVHAQNIENKTFCVRVKRTGKHEFNSIKVEQYVGGGLNQQVESARVKLSKPDFTVHLEIKNENLFIVTERHKGMGGFPIATQEDVLSLMSGGFDSGVASYQMIKKGARTHYCFFNLGGAAHEVGVKQVSYYLWNKFGASHRVKFFAVDFEPVVEEILENIDNGLMGVVLKRMMMRAAEKIANKMGIQALITGEAVGQVSSQTLTNLNVIDRVTETLILRPLIAYDKQDIIDIARKIGTEDFAKTIPEYCGVISKKPTVKAVLAKVEAEEANFDFSILDKVIEETRIFDIRDIGKESEEEIHAVDTLDNIPANSIVLDIRSPEEEDDNPLALDGVEIMHMPFYKLSTQFGDLDKSKEYLLYCDQGVMSKLQALYLLGAGFTNVKVYRP